MASKELVDEWSERAKDILRRCCGTNGVHADTQRYKNTCWTRDTTLAVLPAFALNPTPETDRLLMRHFDRLAALQTPEGQIPILHLDDQEAWVAMKEQEERDEGKTPFMLRRYREGGIHQLTPGTRDSEILYLHGVFDLYDRTGHEMWFNKHRAHMDQALAYIQNNLLDEAGLVTGCDWRDTMEVQLGRTPLLTNNTLLWEVYGAMSLLPGAHAGTFHQKWQDLTKAMRATFWQEGRLLDRPGHDRPDPLGSSLAVLSAFVHPSQYAAVMAGLREVDSPYGVLIQCQHSAFTPKEKAVIERTQGNVVWPWIVGYTILAALKMGERAFAEEQYEKWLRHPGFAEWVDPETGEGYGAPEQLWSAALFLVATEAIEPSA